MSDYIPTFATSQIIARIRGAIAQHGVSQAQLAALCDTSQSQFSKIVRGTRPMTLDQLVVLADALDLDLQSILAEVNDLVFERDNRRSAAMVFVEEGVTLDSPYRFDADLLDTYGQRAHARLEASAAATNVTPIRTASADDLVDHVEAPDLESQPFAAKTGTRKIDQQDHAE